jgi:serine/threonine-protein kinase
MLLEEAAIASCVRHENVVTTYGADMFGDEVVLVMDYVPGLTLSVILQRTHPGGIPARLAAAIMADALRGLHAAHEAKDSTGTWLGIIHRDISPQNILLGGDGIARVLDFGIAKSEGRVGETQSGYLRGKVAYMAPERLRGEATHRRSDVYAAAIVLWETIVGGPLFMGRDDGTTYDRALQGCSTRPGKRAHGVPPALDAVVMRGLALDPKDRFATALDMAVALESVFALDPVQPGELAAWLHQIGGPVLGQQARLPGDMRRGSRPPPPPASSPRPSLAAQHQNAALLAALFFAGATCGLLLMMMTHT